MSKTKIKKTVLPIKNPTYYPTNQASTMRNNSLHIWDHMSEPKEVLKMEQP